MTKRYLPEDEETADKDPRFIKLRSQMDAGVLSAGDLTDEEWEIARLGCKARRERAEREQAEKEKAERENAERERALRDVPYTELGAGATPTFSIVVKDGPMGVDLRELHRELESKRQFGNWADEKLSQFVKGEDFEEVFNNPVKNSVGRPRKDYTVSIECAKHIAMMENTERGKQVRQYFIECEKALKGLHSPATPALPQTRIEALKELVEQLERNEALALTPSRRT